MEKKIQKPWAVYSFSGARASGVGLITKEVEGGSVFIQYYQNDSNDCWDPRYVQRFETPEEAVTHYLRSISLPHKSKEILHRLSRSFPEEFEKLRPEKVKGLCRVLIARADSLLEQSLPKCTESSAKGYSVAELALEIIKENEEPFEDGGEHPFKKDGDGPHPFKKYGTSSFKLRHGLPINGSTGGVDIGD